MAASARTPTTTPAAIPALFGPSDFLGVAEGVVDTTTVDTGSTDVVEELLDDFDELEEGSKFTKRFGLKPELIIKNVSPPPPANHG